MQKFTVAEVFFATTVKQVHFIYFENKDVVSKDHVLTQLILRYDVLLGKFKYKHKPYWQVPVLPEYV